MATMTEVKMTKADAVALLVACGMKAADKFSTPELQKRVNGLPDIEDQIDKKVLKGKHPDQYKLFKEVMAAADNDDLVIVTDGKKKGKDEKPAKGKKSAKPADDDEDDDTVDEGDEDEGDEDEGDEDEGDDSDESDAEDEGDDDSDTEDEEEEVTATKKKPGKDKGSKDAKAKVKDKDKPAKKAEKSDPVGTDRWGCRLGTRAARLNAVITKSPKSAAEIREEAEYDKPISGHLRFLMTKGFVIKTDDNKYREKPTGDGSGKKKVKK